MRMTCFGVRDCIPKYIIRVIQYSLLICTPRNTQFAHATHPLHSKIYNSRLKRISRTIIYNLVLKCSPNTQFAPETHPLNPKMYNSRPKRTSKYQTRASHQRFENEKIFKSTYRNSTSKVCSSLNQLDANIVTMYTNTYRTNSTHCYHLHTVPWNLLSSLSLKKCQCNELRCRAQTLSRVARATLN